MTIQRIVTAVVLADFAALNGYAFYAGGGYAGFIEYLQTMNVWGWVLGADLVIALSMVVLWMWRDAKANGRNPLGYTILTMALGSIGTLLYVLTGRQEKA